MRSLSMIAWFAAAAGCAHARTPDAFRADTEQAFAAKDGELTACYNTVLAKSPSATGRVTVKFAVAEKTGQVTDPQVDPSQTTAPPEVAQCVLAAIAPVTITPPDRNRGQATWTWEFNVPIQSK